MPAPLHEWGKAHIPVDVRRRCSEFLALAGPRGSPEPLALPWRHLAAITERDGHEDSDSERRRQREAGSCYGNARYGQAIEGRYEVRTTTSAAVVRVITQRKWKWK